MAARRRRRFVDAAPLTWPDEWVARHHHHHHRFDAAPVGPGRRGRGVARLPLQLHLLRQGELPRPLPPPRCRGRGLAEVARLRAQGVEYVYFIDEIFLPNRPLLEGLVGRGLKFGVQTRIDLWKPEMLELLGRAGCVSIEAGVESLTQEGRDQLAKNCKLTTEELADRLVEARRHVPFVQANLLEMPQDDTALVDRWRDRLRDAGVWANDPVPLFPYPGSPDYRRLWGLPDDDAWERAVDHYLDHLRRLQRAAGRAPAATARARGRARMTPRRVLMTTDAVGGVWTYALELARGLSAAGVEVMLVVIGPEPSPAQRAEAIEIPGLVLRRARSSTLEWQDRAGPLGPEARQRLLELEQAFEPDIVHCNGFREAAAGFAAPVVVAAHSCVRTWWRACRHEDLPPGWSAYAAGVRAGIGRRDHRGGAQRGLSGGLLRCLGAACRNPG